MKQSSLHKKKKSYFFFLNQWHEERYSWGWKDSSLGKLLAVQDKDPRSDLQHPYKEVGHGQCSMHHNPSQYWWGRRQQIPTAHWRANLAKQGALGSVRHPVSKKKVKSNRGRHPTLSFGVYTSMHRSMYCHTHAHITHIHTVVLPVSINHFYPHILISGTFY